VAPSSSVGDKEVIIMRKHTASLLMLTLLMTVIISITGCVDREPMSRANRLTGPTAPESIWVSVCDTTWSHYRTNAVQINTTNRTATRIEGFSVPCTENIIRYGAVVTYSDTHDQPLKFYLQDSGNSDRKFFLADSLGRTTIPQPANYSGKRYMVLTTANVPVGSYALMMYYGGTISLANSVSPMSVLDTQWNVDAPSDTLHVGCIDCRQVKVPKP